MLDIRTHALIDSEKEVKWEWLWSAYIVVKVQMRSKFSYNMHDSRDYFVKVLFIAVMAYLKKHFDFFLCCSDVLKRLNSSREFETEYIQLW